MADQVTVTNWPKTDSGSPQRVAYDLMARIIYAENAASYANKKSILDLYTECLAAALGHRSVPR